MLTSLNRRLKRRGEDVVLHRSVGTTNTSYVQARVKAFVRPLTAEQLIANITSMKYFLILSPSELMNDKQWPGGRAVVAATNSIIAPSDTRLPTSSDKVYIRGAQKAVSNVSPVFDAGVCIRIEMTVG